MIIGLLVILALVVYQLKLFDADVHLGKFDLDQSIDIGNAFKFGHRQRLPTIVYFISQ